MVGVREDGLKAGLSPRGRGKRGKRLYQHLRRRSIPAWAGETGCEALSEGQARVYPRVGGGNRSPLSQRPCGRGLSPRGRGKLCAGRLYEQTRRSIPAWAGETIDSARAPILRRVYPRVGGGNQICPNSQEIASGLSPRGRGKPRSDDMRFRFRRSIPAWAGETSPHYCGRLDRRVYPRVGGGNMPPHSISECWAGLSPRGRGKRPQRGYAG